MVTLALPYREKIRAELLQREGATVTSVNLHRSALRADVLDAFFRLMKKQPLRCLNISGIVLRDCELEYLLRRLHLIDSLESLNLSMNPLTSEHLTLLAGALTGTKLQRLNLNSTGLTDELMDDVVEILRANEHITELKLSGNEFTDAGVEVLIAYLREEGRPLRVDIGNNIAVSDGVREALTIQLFENNSADIVADLFEKMPVKDVTDELIAFIKQKLYLIMKTNFPVSLASLDYMYQKLIDTNSELRVMAYVTEMMLELIRHKQHDLIVVLLDLSLVRATFVHSLFRYRECALSVDSIEIASLFDAHLLANQHYFCQKELGFVYTGKLPHKTVILRADQIHARMLEWLRAEASRVVPKQPTHQLNLALFGMTVVVSDRPVAGDPSTPSQHGRRQVFVPIGPPSVPSAPSGKTRYAHLYDFEPRDHAVENVQALLPAGEHEAMAKMHNEQLALWHRRTSHSEQGFYRSVFGVEELERIVRDLKASDELRIAPENNEHGHKVYAVVIEMVEGRMLCRICQASAFGLLNPAGAWMAALTAALKAGGFILPKKSGGRLATAMRVTAEMDCADTVGRPMEEGVDQLRELNRADKAEAGTILERRGMPSEASQCRIFANLSPASQKTKLRLVSPGASAQ